MRNALAARPYVPVTVRHRVLEKLAETMGNVVVFGRPGAQERGRALTRDAKERATIGLAHGASDAELTVLVDHLRHTGQLTTRLVLRAVCVGDLRFVEEALAALSGVPLRRVAALVADGRESAFLGLYRRSGMPDRAFPAFAAALEVNRDLMRETGGVDGRPGDRARFSRRLIERVLTRIDMPGRKDVDDLLALLRRFSADAAREQARAVAADRIHRGPIALPAPVVEEVEEVVEAMEVEEVAAPVPTVAVAPEITIDPHRDRLFDFDLDAAIAEAAVAAVAEAPLANRPIADELDEPVGLFANVRLEDLPPEWLCDIEVAELPQTSDPADPTPFLRGGLAA